MVFRIKDVVFGSPSRLEATSTPCPFCASFPVDSLLKIGKKIKRLKALNGLIVHTTVTLLHELYQSVQGSR